jgi:hypothetical protein
MTNWKSWLFNPFKFVAGFKALAIGLVFILAAALIGSVGNIHFDGVLDAHIGQKPAPVWFFITEGLVDWLSLALVLAIFAAAMWRKTSRFIDVVGTQALARWPSILTAVILQCGAYRRAVQQIIAQAVQGQGFPALNPVDMTALIVNSILVIAVTVWMVALMYRAFAVSCNAKGAKAIIAFVTAIIIAEIVSKIALMPLAQLIS